MKRLAAIALTLAIGTAAFAQTGRGMERCELMLMGGAMNYIGDLNNQSVFSMPYAAGGVGVKVNLDNRWSVRAQVDYGHVGCDKDRIELRNLSFKSHVIEVAVMGEFSFRQFGKLGVDYPWTPYIYGGIGVFHFSPEASYVDDYGALQWVDLQPLGTEGQGTVDFPERRPYRLMQLCLPFGVGAKWRVNKTFTLAAEYGLRKTWTDYLDDVSTTYAGSEVLEADSQNGTLAARMADRSGEVREGYVNARGIKRGDDSLDDWYAYFHLSVGIRLDVLLGWTQKKRCKL